MKSDKYSVKDKVFIEVTQLTQVNKFILRLESDLKLRNICLFDVDCPNASSFFFSANRGDSKVIVDRISEVSEELGISCVSVIL